MGRGFYLFLDRFSATKATPSQEEHITCYDSITEQYSQYHRPVNGPEQKKLDNVQKATASLYVFGAPKGRLNSATKLNSRSINIKMDLYEI
jgi:hypothetical protein